MEKFNKDSLVKTSIQKVLVLFYNQKQVKYSYDGLQWKDLSENKVQYILDNWNDIMSDNEVELIWQPTENAA